MYKLSLLDLMTSAFGAAVLLCVLWALLEKESSTPPSVIGEVRGSVRYIVDGDSLYIKGHDPQIRLWGVDAPEKNDPGFKAATSTLKRIALRKSVICQRVDTDQYGRTVARCFLEDGREVNAEMISSGTATEYHHFSKGFYANQLN